MQPNYWLLVDSGGGRVVFTICVPTGNPTRLHWMGLLLMVIKTIWLNSVSHETREANMGPGGRTEESRMGERSEGFGIRTIRMLQYPCIKLSENY